MQHFFTDSQSVRTAGDDFCSWFSSRRFYFHLSDAISS
jgi:hypothetical protein